ncbi:MAG: GWxTD domain-containing protein [Candidatus Aminicenantes bacterium]|nr:MAG: GWxTD domain-containing protein [Candidatus Aminicenantes bacterium]
MCLIVFAVCLVNCGGGPKIELDPTSKDFYETARLIMTKHEKKIFNHLPDKESREEFIQDFWAKRDPDRETEENEFREEFFRRIEYANDHFFEGPPGWKTDRGRIYVYFGQPDRTDGRAMTNIPNMRGWILWIYYRYGFAVYFFDRRGDGQYNIEPTPAELGGGLIGDFSYAIEKAQLGFLPQQDSMTEKFLNFDLDYDRQNNELIISIPTEALIFEEEESILKLDLEFEFFIYTDVTGTKDKLRHTEHFETTEEQILDQDEVVFAIPKDLNPGKYFVDVILTVKPDIGKVRKIFDIKV